jgi:hypothetical protein
VPGQVGGLDLISGPYSIMVNWTIPTVNSYCVTNYSIEWWKTPSGSEDNHTVSSDVFSYTIEDLDAWVEYEVSVTAVNENHEDRNVTGKTAKQTTSNSHTHNAYYIYILVAIMMLVNI